MLLHEMMCVPRQLFESDSRSEPEDAVHSGRADVVLPFAQRTGDVALVDAFVDGEVCQLSSSEISSEIN